MIELNKIYNENCLNTMSRMPNNFIDLTVTSPPYDNLRTYNGYDFDFESIVKELFRVTKKGGVVVWVVGDATINGSETGTSFRQALYFKEIGFNLFDTMIYYKSGMPFPEATRYNPMFEYMFIVSKGKTKTINLLTDKKNKYYGDKVARENSQRQIDGSILENTSWKKDKSKKIKKYGIRDNIWYYSTGRGNSSEDKIAFQHPAQFPEQLAADHIYSWSNKSDLIYDPMAGSGTTIKMAHLLERNWIGSEISADYCQIAEKRIKPYLMQQRLAL